MAQNLNIEYRTLILAAAIPAFLCYAALLVVSHIEALKLGLRGIPRSELPRIRKTLREGWYYIIPLGYLIGILTVNPEANPERIALNTIELMLIMMVILNPQFAKSKWKWLYLLPFLPWFLDTFVIALISAFFPPLQAAYAKIPFLQDIGFLQAIVISAVLVFIFDFLLTKDQSQRALPAIQAGGRSIIEAFEAGARSMIGIAIATAAAGIIVGIVTITGLGFGLADVVQGVANLFANDFLRILVVLIMGQLIALVLGMGLPTTANYILMSALIVPIIARIAGLEPTNPAQMLPVHMFVFYFGIMADSTPPVALAAFAAAAISGGNPVATGVQAFQYELRTALLAYMMFFNPQLLLIANNKIGGLPLGEAIPMVLFAFIGLVAFSAATLRFLHRRTNVVQMLLLLVAAFILIIPTHIYWNLAAMGLIALVYFWQKASGRGDTPPGLSAAA